MRAILKQRRGIRREYKDVGSQDVESQDSQLGFGVGGFGNSSFHVRSQLGVGAVVAAQAIKPVARANLSKSLSRTLTAEMEMSDDSMAPTEVDSPSCSEGEPDMQGTCAMTSVHSSDSQFESKVPLALPIATGSKLDCAGRSASQVDCSQVAGGRCAEVTSQRAVGRQPQRGVRRQRSPFGQSSASSRPGVTVLEPPARRSLPAGGQLELRQERRKRDAEFRLGELRAKPPVIHIEAAVQGCHLTAPWKVFQILSAHQVSPMSVFLPVEATATQKIVAQNACDAMDKGGCALLEAPTGTGKTLSIMAVALAWQWAQTQVVPTSEPPRVVWVARTHEQLLHAVSEFRRLPYRPIMSLRLSRERFCLHPNIRTARNKAEACEIATTMQSQVAARQSKGRGKAPPATGCSYLERAEAIRYPQAPNYRRRFELGGPLPVYDIEELVAEAEALHICPFHAVGDLAMEGAGLIFITYNQLLDPLVRFAGGYEPLFQNAIIIVDEAHNLSQEARDVATFGATAVELDMMRCHFEELGSQLPTENYKKIAKRLVAAVGRLRDWLIGAAAGVFSIPGGAALTSMNSKGIKPGSKVARGVDCLALVRHCGLESVKQVDRDIRDLKSLRKELMIAGLESTAVRSASVNELESFLWKMRFVLDGGSDDYRLVVEPGPRVHFVCLRGAIALQAAVRTAQSLLLASGTLSPFDVLEQELGLGQFSKKEPGRDSPPDGDVSVSMREPPTKLVVQCQAPHHNCLDQMCIVRAVGVVGRVTLDSRMNCRTDGYFGAIGEAIKDVCAAIPNGVVVFFPSYVLLEALLSQLRLNGGYASIEATRPIFIEQRGGKGDDESVRTITKYRAAANCGPALLLAVMRGKAAEGIDLRDAEARGCLVVGVPFPALCVEVELRRQAPGGSRWYEVEAYRQVSQAAGRLLRHQKDFGAVVLLDVRYAGLPPPAPSRLVSPLLAPWLRSLTRPSTLQDACEDIKGFFLRRTAV